MNVLIPVLPLYLSFLGFATGIIGLAVSMVAFARIPVAFAAGYLADLIGRFRALVIGCCASAVGILLLSTASLYPILAGRALVSLFGAFITPVL